MTVVGVAQVVAGVPGEIERLTAVRRRAVLTLPSRAVFAGSVRAFTAAALRCWGIGPEAQDAAVLIVDELASNAVQHGRSDMTLLLALDSDTLRIALTDSGAPAAPVKPDVTADEHGRGLGIVEYLAERVEMRRRVDGCRVVAWLHVTPLAVGGG
jgi:anti-sigma regulatory factor (Ser/Thr protein kinase)